jgi:O-antigen/teichoic acid export membrane protein
MIRTGLCLWLHGLNSQAKYSAFYGVACRRAVPSLQSQCIFRIRDSLAWSLFAATWLCALIVLWRMKKFFPTGREKISFFPERRLLEYSVPLAFSNWAMSGLFSIDLWLVAFLIGPSEAGIYGVMQMLADGVRKVRLSYDPLIVPVVSRMEEHAIPEKLPEVLSYSSHMVSSLQLIIALFLACFYREILSISGSQFAKFGTAFILLIASNLAGGFSGISYQTLLGLGKSSMLLKLNLAMMGIASAAGFILVPSYGLAGAASLSLSVAILQAAILFYLQTRIHGKWPYKKGFLANVARIGGFIVASLLTASWFAGAGLLLRCCVFLLIVAGLGAWAFVVRQLHPAIPRRRRYGTRPLVPLR